MTLTIQTRTGPTTVTPRWQGANLAVHTPHRAPGKPPAPRGQWVITHTGSGLSAGIFNGNLRAAVKLARLWDAAFAAVTVEGVRSWPLRDQWCALVKGKRPPHPPLHGPTPSANAHPARPMAVQFALDAGRRVRHVAGLWQAFWRGQWWELPADDQLQWWTFDSVAESPDGRTVEPDAPDSWLSILALV